MKIALLASRIFNGGVTTHMIDLALELKKRGHKVDIYVGKTSDVNIYFKNILFELQNEGINVFEFETLDTSKSKLVSLVDYFRLVVFLKKVLKNKYDIVHTHSMSLSLALQILRIKFVKTIHIAKNAVGLLNATANQEIAISDEIYEERLPFFVNNLSHLNLIYNGVSRKFYDLFENSSNGQRTFVNNKIQILIVASINYRKGQDVLLQALDMLDDNYLEQLEINFLGDYNSEAKEWLHPFINDRINKRIHFQGLVKPDDYYKKSNITILPSRLEGFPLTIVEAMLTGNLVIRSNVEGASQQINSDIGYLFENENYTQLSEILIELINNKNLIFDKGIKGRNFAFKNFTLEQMVDKVEIVYNKILY